MDIDDQSNLDGDEHQSNHFNCDSLNNSIHLNSSFSNRYNNNRVSRFEILKKNFRIIFFFVK